MNHEYSELLKQIEYRITIGNCLRVCPSEFLKRSMITRTATTRTSTQNTTVRMIGNVVYDSSYTA